MPKPSLREHILDAGLAVMFQQGYAGASVRDIVGAASAPQGSFTNHFGSKEAFASEVLDRYFIYVQELMAQTLGNKSLLPLNRIRAYLDLITQKLTDAEFCHGCLIGDFSLETPTHSELLRQQLQRIFAAWHEPFAHCIREAQKAGQLTDTLRAEDLADVVIAGWQGSILRMKVERSVLPLEQFKTVAFATFLKDLTT